MTKSLRVLARGGILVIDVDHASAATTRGQRKYVGRKSVKAWKEEDLPEGCPRHLHSNEFLEQGQQSIPHMAFPSLGRPVTVSNSSYYRKVVKKGALWPADAETAAACGVRFDPTFGGEYPELVKKSAAMGRKKDGDE